jgi:hypothetical protein
MARYDQCDVTCTADCGHCKGQGRPPVDGQARRDGRHQVLVRTLRFTGVADAELVADQLIRALWAVDSLPPLGLLYQLESEVARVRELAGRLEDQLQPYAPNSTAPTLALIEGWSEEELRAEVARLSALAGFNLRRAQTAERALEQNR